MYFKLPPSPTLLPPTQINEIIESEPCDISNKLLLNQHYDPNDPYLKTAVFERSHSQQDRRRVTLSGKPKQNTEIRQRLQQQDQHAKLMQSSRPIVTTTTQVDKAQSTSISMLASPELSDENQGTTTTSRYRSLQQFYCTTQVCYMSWCTA